MDERDTRILQLISLISTGAVKYVRSAFAREAVPVLYYGDSGANQGVFCVAEDEGCVIAYAAFRKYDEPDVLLEVMKQKISLYLQASEQREICFNVYGSNTEIVQFVRGLGFVSDLEGYQLQYVNDRPVYAEEASLLQEQGFTPDMLEPFIALFDTAYEQLSLENGWRTDRYRREPEVFLRMLEGYEASGQVRSFWLQDSLAGAYITDGAYIRDLVVAPEFQNCGYGRTILQRCVNHMRSRTEGGNIYLRVAESNVGAKRFYERNQFVAIARFAEHTYRRQEQ
ncbi:GNAT family N-acetyltransferase [Paenibacillus pedocola]|uniref:GNAT family N-acetyltransferase n=1 Tax=Paenibacillus pedocola TaxID=3242193 RepID=UPI0028776FAB|nr:GNAT family N-acetyltransferase [Paenibacillus typhae]